MTIKEVYSADIVLRIRIPTFEELDLIKPHNILACMVHRDTHPEMVKVLGRRQTSKSRIRSSRRYSEQLLPFIKLLANFGLERAIKQSSFLKGALIS